MTESVISRKSANFLLFSKVKIRFCLTFFKGSSWIFPRLLTLAEQNWVIVTLETFQNKKSFHFGSFSNFLLYLRFNSQNSNCFKNSWADKKHRNQIPWKISSNRKKFEKLLSEIRRWRKNFELGFKTSKRQKNSFTRRWPELIKKVRKTPEDFPSSKVTISIFILVVPDCFNGFRRLW